MAYFSRLILALLLCLTFNISANAAEIVPSGPLGCPPDPAPGYTTTYDSNPAFTRARECHVGEAGPGTATWGNMYQCTAYSWCPYWYPSHTVSAVPTCPADSTLNGSGQCECAAGYTADGGTCKPPPPDCSVNQELDEETNTCVCKHGPAGAFAVAGDVMTGCNDGCTIYLTSGSYSKSTNKTYGSWNQNGNTCSPSSDTPGVDSPDSADGQDAGKCPAGQCPGTFNGQFMCVPCKGKEASDSSSSENTSETPEGASAPSGSASQSQSGSKSTECDGGVCTTKETVVTRNPDGSTTEQQKETTESISDYCAKNPKTAICKASEEGQWGGSCGNFVCSGDAVQCAQAKEAAALRCALTVDPGSPLVATAEAAITAASGVTTFGVSVPGFDSTNPYTGTCPVDVNVAVSGMSFTIPLSQTCPYIQFVGWCLVAAASLAGARVAFT